MGQAILDATQYTNLKNEIREELMDEVRMEFHTQMHMLDRRLKRLETNKASRRPILNGEADDHMVKCSRICDTTPGRNKSFRGCMDIMDVGQSRPPPKQSPTDSVRSSFGTSSSRQEYQLIHCQEQDDSRTLVPNREEEFSDKTIQKMSKETSDLEEAVTDETAEPPPESMYNYCMQRLAASPDPLRDPALSWWLLLWSVQFVTLVSFSAYNDILNNEIGATPPLQRSHAIGSCLYGSLDVQGVPVVYIVIGLSSILLVSSVISAETIESLSAPFPSHEQGTIWWIKRFAWFWEVVYMPGCFALEAAILFASSRDPLGVVTNTLQVTFIMDIDNLLYHYMLSAEQKNIYLRREGCHGYVQKRPHQNAMRGMFALNLVLMSTLFTTIAITFDKGELYGEEYLHFYWNMTYVFYCLMFGGRYGFQVFFSDSQNNWKADMIRALGASLLGLSFYFIALNLTTTEFIFPPFKYFDDPAEFTCAHDGMSNVTRVMVG